MKLTLLMNKTGLIHGNDPRRIGCDTEGILKIGTTEVSIMPGDDSIMPTLFHGATGDYDATFTDKHGKVFALEKVEVRGGRIAPPPHQKLELLSLRCRADRAERECKLIREQIEELRNIFDTNSLNFLIK